MSKASYLDWVHLICPIWFEFYSDFYSINEREKFHATQFKILLPDLLLKVNDLLLRFFACKTAESSFVFANSFELLSILRCSYLHYLSAVLYTFDS